MPCVLANVAGHQQCRVAVQCWAPTTEHAARQVWGGCNVHVRQHAQHSAQRACACNRQAMRAQSGMHDTRTCSMMIQLLGTRSRRRSLAAEIVSLCSSSRRAHVSNAGPAWPTAVSHASRAAGAKGASHTCTPRQRPAVKQAPPQNLLTGSGSGRCGRGCQQECGE